MEEHQTNDQALSDNTNGNLSATKKRALEALVGLIPQIDTLEPTQKFRICIDAIRFTDNKELIDIALNAALAIKDLEEQANAIIELVAEINYLEEQNK